MILFCIIAYVAVAVTAIAICNVSAIEEERSQLHQKNENDQIEEEDDQIEYTD